MLSSTHPPPGYFPSNPPSYLVSTLPSLSELPSRLDSIFPLGSSLTSPSPEPNSQHLPHILASARAQPLSKPAVRIVLSEPLIFITPPGKDWSTSPSTLDHTDERPGKDGLLSGVVHVVQPAKKLVKGIKIELRCLLKMMDLPTDGYRASVALKKTVLLGGKSVREGIWLNKGLNSFEFAITIPASAPTSETNFWGSISRTLSATILGSRPFPFRDLGDSRPVYVACFPNRKDNNLQFRYEAQGVASDLGPFGCKMSSNEFLVGAPIALSLSLLSIPRDLTIYAINVYIEQHVTVAPSSPTEIRTIANWKAHVLTEGATGNYQAARAKGLIVVDGQQFNGEFWKWSRIARLPSSDKIGPTTLPGTDSPLRSRSDLVFEIVYSRAPAKVKNPTVKVATFFRKPVTIASCCCMSGHLTLPLYSELKPTTPGKDDKSVEYLSCMCTETWDVMERRERELNRMKTRTESHPRSTTEDLGKATRPKLGRSMNASH